MKKIKEILLTIVLPVVLIILFYVAYDSWTLMNLQTINQPVLKADFLSSRIVGPVIPHEKLARRKFVVFEGKEIIEKEYTRVLILDMDGNGIETCGLKAIRKCKNWLPGNVFDFNHDGFEEKTPLIGEDDAILLYRPLNNNNFPKDGVDIIGTYFVHTNLDKNRGSFDILRNLAKGKDYLDKESDLFEKIRLLTYGKKRNLSAPMTLADLEIEQISLVPYQQQIFDNAGNILGDYSEVVFLDGRKTKLQEVWLLNDSMVINVSKLKPSEKIADIPDIQGIGTISSLRDKIQNDENEELAELVRSYLKEQNFLRREGLLLDIIYKWSGVYDANPMSRVSEDGINYIGDARKVMTLEKVLGRPFVGTHSGAEETPNPHRQSVPYVLEGFSEYVDFQRNRLDKAGILVPLLESVKMQNQNEWDVDLADFKEKIKLYAANHDAYEVKLFLTSFYENLTLQKKRDYLLLDDKKINSIKNKIKGIGKISSKIDMKNFGKMVIKGTVGEDNLIGLKNEDNIFIGATGDDVLSGGTKDDVYIYGLNDGIDVIDESGGYDRIMFISNINPEKITFEMKHSDLLIKINYNDWQVIRIKDYTLGVNKQVEKLIFADGQKSNLAEIYQNLLISKQPMPMPKHY